MKTVRAPRIILADEEFENRQNRIVEALVRMSEKISALEGAVRAQNDKLGEASEKILELENRGSGGLLGRILRAAAGAPEHAGGGAR